VETGKGSWRGRLAAARSHRGLAGVGAAEQVDTQKAVASFSSVNWEKNTISKFL
jgi:hypothetical protein